MFEDLGFAAQGAIECLRLSTADHRLLDPTARRLVVEEFASYPSTELLLATYDSQVCV